MSKRYCIITIVIDEGTRKGVLKNSVITIPKIIKDGFLESSITYNVIDDFFILGD